MAGPRKDISKTARDIFVNRDGPIETIERIVAGLGNALGQADRRTDITLCNRDETVAQGVNRILPRRPC